MRYQLRPLDSGLDDDQTALAVEVDHAAHPTHVEEDGPCAELLSAHRVPATGNADLFTCRGGSVNSVLELQHGLHVHHAIDGRFVQLRVHVVHEHGWATAQNRAVLECLALGGGGLGQHEPEGTTAVSEKS